MKADKHVVAVYEDKDQVKEALEIIEKMDIDVEHKVSIQEFSHSEVFESEIKKKSAKRVLTYSSIVFIILGVVISVLAASGMFGPELEANGFEHFFVMVCGGFCLGALAGMVAGMVGALAVGPEHYSFKDHFDIFDIDYYAIKLNVKSKSKIKKVREMLNFSKRKINTQIDQMNAS